MTKINTKKGGLPKMKNLPRGMSEKIARKFGVRADYVSKIKSGKRNNIEILRAITAELTAHRRTTEALLKKIHK